MRRIEHSVEYLPPVDQGEIAGPGRTVSRRGKGRLESAGTAGRTGSGKRRSQGRPKGSPSVEGRTGPTIKVKVSFAGERFRQLLSEAPALLYSGFLDLPPRATFVSESIRWILGFEPGDVTQNPAFWLEHVHPDDVAGVVASHATLMREGHNVWEYRMRTKAGGYVWLRDHIRLVRNARNHAMELVGCAIDITEQRQIGETLRSHHAKSRMSPEPSPDRIPGLQQEERLNREKAERESFARELMLAQEKERNRIASELHDGLGQNVLVIKQRAERGLDQPARPEAMEESLAAVVALAGQSIRDIRTIVHHLRPHLIAQLGLTGAMRAIIDTLGKASRIQFHAEIEDIDGVLNPETEMVFYRVFQECLNNVVKHSQAAEARIEVRRDAGRLRASVQDNGRGFDPQHPLPDGQDQGGFGLQGISERMALLQGSARIIVQPGQGTRIELELPIEGPGSA